MYLLHKLKEHFFWYTLGKKEEQGIEFSVNSPDGKSLQLMPLSDQCEVSS